MISGQDVVCDESELTGEPDPVEKTTLTQDNYNEEGVVCVLVAKSLCV